MKKIIAILIMVCVSISAHSTGNALRSVKVLPLPEGRMRIDFIFTQPIKQLPASFITEKPARLVLDFIDATVELPADEKRKKVNMGSINNYTVVAMGTRVRALLNLERTVTYSGSSAGNTYSLIVNGKVNEFYENKRQMFITNKPVNARHELYRLNFRGIERQGGRVILDVSDASIPVDVTQKGKEVVVHFTNTRIPPRMMKRFDVSDFHAPAQVITMQQDGKNVTMTIVNKGDYGHYVYQVNKQFMVDLFPLTAEEAQKAKLKKEVFSGKRISLDFQDISVRSVLQLLADFTGINIIVSDDVKNNITIRLNDIPWDQALDIILTSQGLDKRRNGNVIFVNTKDNLDKMEQEELKSQQAIQKLEPIRSELIQVNYAKATDLAILIKDKQNSLLSDRGKVSVDVRTNTLWIQDTGAKIEEIRELIKQLDIPVKQVQIEARIVEVNKKFAEDIGIRWGVSRPNHLSGTLDGANQTLPGGSATANPDFPLVNQVNPYTKRLNLDLVAAPVSGSTPASLGIALAKLGDNILLDLELSALESEGRGELISSPRLVTTNQQPAVIQSGEEIPYQESTSSGATAVAFKQAVLSLKVTPQITPDGKILMDLQINQDTPSTEKYNGVPAIRTKSIQTNVLVNNGQTIVLGGIYRQDKTKTIQRIPFFGQLPVVGSFFRNTQTGLTNDELLIFITPKIITNALSLNAIEGREKGIYK